ncbi:chemotaxis protein CheX [Sphingomonas sp. BN140010]|uniref:Chemotaxis protein CheX n=1 Tax=Sphingomonas arvum TaxID=2992113 RepID=A0ABT3JB98_9SPHN|nr:chemotaxis protein CheX [Sphingomonas sp. BN140010]MCW3796327.1 chemotaxis protein CheX [Sphingomonas sp. BN140010]
MSSVDEIELSELEQDALTEVVNIGVSRAALSLRKMVGEHVLLSVPSVEVLSRKRAAALLVQQSGDKLVAVKQNFTGAFSGGALLIFPQARSLELVRAVIGPEMPDSEVAEMEHEALAETGNVILNNCLATMANMLKRPLTMSIPQVVRGDGTDLLNQQQDDDADAGLVLFLYITFSVRERDLRGYIAMMMNMSSLLALKELLGGFIAETMDGEF